MMIFFKNKQKTLYYHGNLTLPIKISMEAGLFNLDMICCHYNERHGVSNHQPHDCVLNRFSGSDQRKHQSSASLAFVRGIHRWRVNFPHKGPVMRRMFSLDDVMISQFSGNEIIGESAKGFVFLKIMNFEKACANTTQENILDNSLSGMSYCSFLNIYGHSS